MAGMVAQMSQSATASGASMGVLKKVLDASASLGADLASLASGVAGSGGQLNVYA